MNDFHYRKVFILSMGKNVYAFHVHKILLCFYAFIKESLIIVFTKERLLMLFKHTGTAYKS
jgi:hypothetical protein